MLTKQALLAVQDAAVDLSLRCVVYGTAAGALTAILLFRGPSVRAAATAFGAGTGVGCAWTENQKLFREALGVKPSKA